MTMLLISPDYPPRLGGVSDHGRHLARGWAKSGLPVSVLTSSGIGATSSEDPFPVQACLPTWNQADLLLDAIRRHASPDRQLIWQYVPHLYGRGGVHTAPAKVMTRLRLEGFQQLLLAHEISADYSLWPHRAWYVWNQRRSWNRILEEVDAIGFSTEVALKRWTGRRPSLRDHSFLAPSPSNIPRAPLPPDVIETWRQAAPSKQSGTWLVFFGGVGSGLQPERLLAPWRQLRQENPSLGLAILGRQLQPDLSPDEAPWFRSGKNLPARDISLALQSAHLVILPYVDGVSERRCSFHAALEHGCPVLTTIGHNTGPSLRHAPIMETWPAREPLPINRIRALLAQPDRLQNLGRQARKHYECEIAWPIVLERIRQSFKNMH